MRFSRVWTMPNKLTFDIKLIKELLDRYVIEGEVWIDPFARDNKVASITNDLDPDTTAMYHMDALDFLLGIESASVNGVLFDPPYSSRQVSESYKRLGRSVSMTDTQGSFWSKLKREIGRIVKPGGLVISCAWNTNGIGKTLGFAQLEILLVAHGGVRNDTLITVERKAQ